LKEIHMSVLQVYLYGAGRDVQTKAQRRLDRFQRRHFRVGDVLVRPGRRVPVSHEFLARHEAELAHHIQRGALRLQTDADAFIDPDELKRLIAGEPPLPESPPATPEKGAEKKEGAEKEPEPTPPAEGGEPLKSEEAPAPEPEKEPEGAQTEPTGPEAEGAGEGGQPDPTVGADPLALPDAWRTRNKRGLLMLCTERGLVNASDKLSNKEIISMLEEWEKVRAAALSAT
jgi:hypothetical protein